MVRLLSKDGGRFPCTACETQCKVNTTILKGSPVFVNESRKVMARLNEVAMPPFLRCRCNGCENCGDCLRIFGRW